MTYYQAKVVASQIDAPIALSVPKWRWWLVNSLRLGSVLMLLAAIAQLVVIRTTGDWWWFGTVLLFAPRWPLLAPIAVLFWISAVLDWRSLGMNVLAGAIVAWPLMGWNAPKLWGGRATGGPIRVMSINAGGGTSFDLLQDEIDRERPDVVVVQEITPDLPPNIFDKTWHVFSDGGLCIASRFPILRTDAISGQSLNRWSTPAAAVEIETERGKIWIIGVHLETPRWGFEELELNRSGLHGVSDVDAGIERRRHESELVQKWIAAHEGPKVVAGDFNMPTESDIYHRYWSRWNNAFSNAGVGYGHTKYTKWHGVRIDHVLYNGDWQVNSVGIGNSAGGDHRPLIVDLSQKTLSGGLQ